MTEEEWLRSENFDALNYHLREVQEAQKALCLQQTKTADFHDYYTRVDYLRKVARKWARKRRLVGANVYRLLCHDPSSPQEIFHLDLAERYADDPALIDLVRSSIGERNVLPLCVLDYDPDFEDYNSNELHRVFSFALDRLNEKWDHAHPGIDLSEYANDDPLWKDRNLFLEQAVRPIAVIFRDIFGNPFRPVDIELTWLTANVVDLAQTIYDDRAFDRLPILADALMDAGCEDERVLEHCRSEGPHVRGCWVVDMLLGKS